MDNIIISFLRKERNADKVSNTNGKTLFFGDTCIASWKQHSVILNNTEYEDAEINDFIDKVESFLRKSYLIYHHCSKYVPLNSKTLIPYV